MKRTASKMKSFRRQGVTILILLLALGAYLAFLVPTQRSFFTERNFRLLAGMCDHIKNAMAYLASSLANATRPPPPQPPAMTNGSPFLTAIKMAYQDRRFEVTPSRDYVQSVLGLVSNLTLVRMGTNAPTNGLAAVPSLDFQVASAGPATLLELDYRDGTNTYLQLKARSDLRRLLMPIVNRKEFDDVLVVNTNHEVIFQRSSSPLLFTRLEVPAGRSFQTNLVDFAGTDYKLFAQPLEFAPSPPGVRVSSPVLQWTLCGLVRADRFNRQATAVSYTLLLIFFFLAALLLFSWPFLNVWSLGLKGGLRVGEVFLLVSSVLATSAFLALLLLEVFAYEQMEDTHNEQLGAFATNMVHNLQTELVRVDRQLDLLNRRFLEPTNAVNKTNLLSTDLLRLEAEADPYPFFEMAFWTDWKGEQLVKWTLKDQRTPLINVAHRAYFRSLAEGRPYTMNVDGRHVHFGLEPIFSLNTGENLAIYTKRPTMDSNVMAAIDLRLLSVVGPVLPAGFGFCIIDEKGLVLFHSDQGRNLRENFFQECNHDPRLRAAVLGHQTVCFDLKYARQPHTVFILPLPNFPWSLVTFREGTLLGSAQLEMISVAILLFLAYLVLLAVVFGSAYVLGAQRHLGWLWPTDKRSGAYGLLTILHLALGFLFLVGIFASRESGWKIAAAVLIPAVALYLSYRGLSRGWVGSAWLRLASRTSRLRISYRAGYVLSMGLLLMLLSVLPMLAFFKAASDKELRLLVKHAQLDLAKELQARTDRVWHQSRSVAGPGPRQAFFDHRVTNQWDLYTRFYYDSRIDWQAPNEEHEHLTRGADLSWLENWLIHLRPHYNEQDVFTRSVLTDAAADGAWWWTNRAPGGVVTNQLSGDLFTNSQPRLVLTRSGFHLPVLRPDQHLSVDSRAPGFPTLSAPWLLLLLVVMAAPFLIVFVVSDKVLLLRVSPPPGHASAVMDPAERHPAPPWGPGRYLLLGPPRCGKSDLLGPRRFLALSPRAVHALNLRRAEDRALLAPDRHEELLAETDKALVIDHFEYALDDPKWTREKLRFLEHVLLDEPRTVVIVSNVHPLHFAMELPAESAAGGSESGPQPSAVAAEAAAWMEVLSGFKKLYCQGRSGWSSTTTAEGQTSHEARSLYRSLWHTCSPSEQEILHQVAQRRLISSYQPELATLLDRGLLRREPALQLMDEPFRRFVLAHYRPAPLGAELREESLGLWQSLRGPMMTVVVILAAFFFATQKELWHQSVALVTAFVTGIGAFAKGFEFFQKSRMKRQAME